MTNRQSLSIFLFALLPAVIWVFPQAHSSSLSNLNSQLESLLSGYSLTITLLLALLIPSDKDSFNSLSQCTLINAFPFPLYLTIWLSGGVSLHRLILTAGIIAASTSIIWMATQTLYRTLPHFAENTILLTVCRICYLGIALCNWSFWHGA